MHKFKKPILFFLAPLFSLSIAVPALADRPLNTGIARAEEASSKLAETKLKVCQQRESRMTALMSHLGDRGQAKLDVFTKIADRTETFYAKKGKVLANYDALVSVLNDKKAAAQTAVDTVKATSASFKCDGSDPKGLAGEFKTNVMNMNSALKDYRTAVKNLIVGVKSVQSTSEPGAGND